MEHHINQPDDWPSMAFFFSLCSAAQLSAEEKAGQKTCYLTLLTCSYINNLTRKEVEILHMYIHTHAWILNYSNVHRSSPSCAFCYVTHLSPKSIARVCQVKSAHGLQKQLQINIADIMNYDPMLLTNNRILYWKEMLGTI